jgi:hypothetical protein
MKTTTEKPENIFKEGKTVFLFSARKTVLFFRTAHAGRKASQTK